MEVDDNQPTPSRKREWDSDLVEQVCDPISERFDTYCFSILGQQESEADITHIIFFRRIETRAIYQGKSELISSRFFLKISHKVQFDFTRTIASTIVQT